MPEIQSWAGFYTFVGTVAATLMGLIFVVVSLGRGIVGTDRGTQAVRAFYTPIIVFFSTDILASTVVLIPHATAHIIAVSFGIIGAVSLIYMLTSGAFHLWRANELSFDDLLFYIVLPFVAYIGLCIAAALLWTRASFALYLSAAIMILLLTVGIRNAWDLVLSIAREGTN